MARYPRTPWDEGCGPGLVGLTSIRIKDEECGGRRQGNSFLFFLPWYTQRQVCDRVPPTANPFGLFGG